MKFKVGDKIRTVCPPIGVHFDKLNDNMYGKTGVITWTRPSTQHLGTCAYGCTISNEKLSPAWIFYEEELISLGREYKVYIRRKI